MLRLRHPARAALKVGHSDLYLCTKTGIAFESKDVNYAKGEDFTLPAHAWADENGARLTLIKARVFRDEENAFGQANSGQR